MKCPRCDSERINKDGNHNGLQRYRCKECHKRFDGEQYVYTNDEKKSNKVQRKSYKKLWMDRFELYKEFVIKTNQLPESSTVYQNIPIGQWIKNQRNLYNQGSISKEKIQLLDNVNEGWKKSLKERQEINKMLMVNSNWKKNISDDAIPLDFWITDENMLYKCIEMRIYDCDSLVKKYFTEKDVRDKLGEIDVCHYYAKRVPYLYESYTRLICDMRGYPYDVKSFGEFSFTSPEDMRTKIDISLSTLEEKEEEIVRLYYGMGREKKSLKEIAVLYNYKKIESVEKLIAKVIRKMLHPYRSRRLFRTGTELDKYELSWECTNNLYRAGFTQMSEVIQFINTCKILGNNLSYLSNDKEELLEFYKKIIEIPYEEYKYLKAIAKEKILEMGEGFVYYSSINEVKLPCRAHKGLKEAGKTNINEVFTKYGYVWEEISQVRGWGVKCNEEAEKSIKEFFGKYEQPSKELEQCNLRLPQTGYLENKEINNVYQFCESLYKDKDLLLFVHKQKERLCLSIDEFAKLLVYD